MATSRKPSFTRRIDRPRLLWGEDVSQLFLYETDVTTVTCAGRGGVARTATPRPAVQGDPGAPGCIRNLRRLTRGWINKPPDHTSGSREMDYGRPSSGRLK